MHIGLLISGLGHFFLLVWILASGYLTTVEQMPELETTQVSIMSASEFAGLNSQRPNLPPSDAPEQVVMVQKPESEIAPPQPEPTPSPAKLEALAKLQPAPRPDPAPIALPAPEEQLMPSDAIEPQKPQEAVRVAAVAVPPPPDAAIAAEVTPVEIQAPKPVLNPVEDPAPKMRPSAPEAATTQIITEATETQKTPSLAPQTSIRPKPRPVVTEQPVPEALVAPKSEEVPQDLVEKALAEALAQVVPAEPAPAPFAASGASLTADEVDSLRLAVQSCWNVGSLSSDAMNVVVTIAFSIEPNGRPDPPTIRMLTYENGSAVAARQAYEAGRRAIRRCGAKGFKLPKNKYDQWKDVEMVFNPKEMRMK
ncbi:MAG: cell envelope biogenesis protein TolA [Paracoccaceae bacterium]|jgi:hypothetical protein